ncbi:MAG: hypothetical protein KBS68_03490 [Clostridiales bacterium]|nr:hypothetical protein [Candidatus Crickella merdequi]
MIKKVIGLYFSPVEESIQVIESIAEEVAAKLNEEDCCDVHCEFYDFGAILMNDGMIFDNESIVVIGAPAVNGKIPMPCLKLMQLLEGNDTMAIVVVTYAGTTYGRALKDLYTFTEMRGFKVISAAAFVARVEIGGVWKKVIESRPDARDFDMMTTFGKISGRKIRRLGGCDVELMQVKPAPLTIGRGKRTVAIAVVGRIKRKEPEWFI